MTNRPGCLGKIAYPTKADAERARRVLYERRDYGARGKGRESTLMNVYPCPCGAFHIGRAKRAGLKAQRHDKDHWKGSQKSRYARYKELVGQ